MNEVKLIHESIQSDNWSDLERLIVGRRLSADDPFTWDHAYAASTPLQLASSFGALKTIKGLVKIGADIDKGKTYGSPLYCAVSFRRHKAVELLLELGADPNRIGPSMLEGDSRWTPLICATFFDESPIVSMLLRYGASLTVVSRRGIGALTCAAHKKNHALIDIFLASGSPRLGNAVLCAVDNGDKRIASMLLDGGCDPNYTAGKAELCSACNGVTPLFLAIQRHGLWLESRGCRAETGQCNTGPFFQIIQLLIRYGANPNILVQNRTPLSLAVWSGDVEVVRLMLAAGADVRGSTYSEFLGSADGGLKFYETALHSAVRYGHVEIFRELLKSGANPSDTDHAGVSVFTVAEQSPNRVFCELLQRK